MVPLHVCTLKQQHWQWVWDTSSPAGVTPATVRTAGTPASSAAAAAATSPPTPLGAWWCAADILYLVVRSRYTSSRVNPVLCLRGSCAIDQQQWLGHAELRAAGTSGMDQLEVEFLACFDVDR